MRKILLLLLCVNYAFAQTQTSVQTTINTNLVNPLKTINIKNSVTAVNQLAGKAATDAALALSQIAGLQAGQNPETDPTVPANVKAISATNINNWNNAFGWGNHASAGYLTSVGSVPYGNITGVPNFILSGASIPYATLTGVPAESDPTVSAASKAITSTNVTNWNSAYGWGNHASAGYLTSATAASTYQTLSNLSIDLTASNTKYPTTTAVNTGLGLKANVDSPTITGTATLPASTTIGAVSPTELSYVDGVISALQPQLDAKLASTTAATTYQSIANLSTDLTASATKYPSVNAVNTGLSTRALTTYVDAQVATREPTITAGTTAQYIRGDKTLATFPTIPTNANYVDLTTAQSIAGIKTHTALTKYATDLSGTYDARTLTDKGYVDGQVATKEATIAAGTTGQYWRGDKTWQTFPNIPSSTDFVDVTTAQSVAGVKTFTNKPTFTDTWANYQATFGSTTQAGRIGFSRASDAAIIGRIGFTSATENSAFDISNTAGSGSINLTVTGGTSFKMFSDGNLGLQAGGTYTNTGEQLQVGGVVRANQYKLSALNTAPASATATGTLGEIRVTSGFIYVCTATNTWVRAALATW